VSAALALLQLAQDTLAAGDGGGGGGILKGLIDNPAVQAAFYAFVATLLAVLTGGLLLLKARLDRKSKALDRVGEVRTQVESTASQVQVDAEIVREAARVTRAYMEALGGFESRLSSLQKALDQMHERAVSWETVARGLKKQMVRMKAQHQAERGEWQRAIAELTRKYEMLLELDRQKGLELAEQAGRIAGLEASLSARDAYIDEIEPLIPEPTRAEITKRRPNGKAVA
jgi:chromosome segregation ATPase